jgi:hypothetical protein
MAVNRNTAGRPANVHKRIKHHQSQGGRLHPQALIRLVYRFCCVDVHKRKKLTVVINPGDIQYDWSDFRHDCSQQINDVVVTKLACL